jgi:hypothetical protein
MWSFEGTFVCLDRGAKKHSQYQWQRPRYTRLSCTVIGLAGSKSTSYRLDDTIILLSSLKISSGLSYYGPTISCSISIELVCTATIRCSVRLIDLTSSLDLVDGKPLVFV